MGSLIEQWRNPETEIRVSVQEWICRQSIKNQFIEYARDPWIVWNYLKKIGLYAVINKLRSRLSERKRNQKIIGLGVGLVLETPDNLSHLLNNFVLFFAPNQSSTSNTVVVSCYFIEPLPQSINNGSQPVFPPIDSIPSDLLLYRAWSPYSGKKIDVYRVKNALAAIARNIDVGRLANISTQQLVVDHCYFNDLNNLVESKPSAVLFGLGNYAKTVILPNIQRNLSLKRVHEVDPDQLEFFGSSPKIDLDTSPVPRDNHKFDVWLIAGFHHTHTNLAVKAIEQGSFAVIEKPLATTKEEYDSFIATLNRHLDHRFFLCFNKRYSELHDYFISDIGCPPWEPVDMHCIVYEIPLPEYHWYNWPNSGSRLVSNGCHWLDYFMYVNDYSPVVDYRKWQPRGSDVIVQVSLENGAYFSMSLTDTGSQRLGVRDHIELRHRGVTITITDAAFYSAENRSRIFRRKRVNPLNAFTRMYKKISQAILQNDKGDDLKSLRSSELTLLLEEVKFNKHAF